MVTRKVVIAEPSGLHLRPAGKLCEVCQRYQSKIQIKKGDSVANAKSVLGLLAARVQMGDEVEVVCDGLDEQEALDKIIHVIKEGFGLSEV